MLFSDHDIHRNYFVCICEKIPGGPFIQFQSCTIILKNYAATYIPDQKLKIVPTSTKKESIELRLVNHLHSVEAN